MIYRSLFLLSLATLALSFPVSSSSSDEEAYFWYEFGKFTAKYNKEYNGVDEFHGSYATFKANVQKINAHNAKPSTYKLAINQFADMTYEQFSKKHLGYKPSAVPRSAALHVSQGTPAASVDWRTKGAVNPVKDQGSCGSCWAFSTIASLESAHALSTKKLVSLSEQQLVDCSGDFGNQGCNGGLMDQAFQYLINATKGDDTEAAYPYKGVDGTCAYKPAAVGATIKSYVDVPAQNEDALINAVSSIGVVSVAIQASDDFMFYSSGVYDGSCSSDPQQLNHGVAAVGYGADFWVVRNSWGSSWGESGYIRMARGKNICGIADVASYPVV